MREANLKRAIEAHTVVIPWTGCWIWMSTVDRDGYAKSSEYDKETYTQKNVNVHRAVFEAVKGPIPEGYHADHLCNVRCCVNPYHLEAVTPKENAHRMIRRGGLRGCVAMNVNKTVCKHGHEFTDANTKVRYDGHRECRACRRAYEKVKEARKRIENTRGFQAQLF